MIASKALIAKFQLALAEGWGYILGQSGAIWTQAKQNAATDEMAIKYGSKWIGKRVADCSGLFSWAFKELGGSIYHGSNTIWRSYCTTQGTLVAGQEIRPGTALFKVNGTDRYHIGLYVGGDTVIEARGTQTGVVTSSVSTWHEWGELKGVDYSDGEAVLCKGCTGEAVRELQEGLLQLGYELPMYGADGEFGSETEKAVKAFQSDCGLNPDGKYGEKTREAMRLALVGMDTGEKLPDQSESKNVVIVSEGGVVNVRKGNATTYGRITQVKPGMLFEHVATAANGWNAIVVGAQVGWVSGEYSRLI